MEKKKRYQIFPLLIFIYSLLVALFWTALRINYAGISKFMGADTNPSFLVMYLPVMICVLLWLLCAYGLLAALHYSKKRVYAIISLILSVVFTAAIVVVVCFGSADYLSFILPHFFRSLLAAAVIGVFALLLFYPWRSGKKGVLRAKWVLCAAVIAVAVIAGYQLRGNRFSCDAVVYAVEEDYQIVFSTSDNSIAWVEINGQRYYDLYAGSMRSKDLVHKVTIPQTVLDGAGDYTICAQQMIYRGPFGGYKGKVISQDHDFTPVNSKDGLRYYVLSDVHGAFDGAINAAKGQGDLDFLVVLGDTVSMVERPQDANATSSMASAITGGSIPVLYARGNHEIKGETAEDLYKYVGSQDQKFYYTFTLGDVKGIVLDLGEDHDDDWWEYYETAQFDLYRDEQTALLQKCIDDDFFAGSAYRMVLCHIPVNFVNARENHVPYKTEWTKLINEMNIDVMLSGHQHDLTVFAPGTAQPGETLTYNSNFSGVEGKTYGGYLTDHNFYTFLAAKAANDQLSDTKSLRTSDYTGLCMEADLTAAVQTARYTNALGQNVPVCSMFGTDTPAEAYHFPMKTTAKDNVAPAA
jgi:heme/copper-type cytochrome/quinol oxidase subunit 4